MINFEQMLSEQEVVNLAEYVFLHEENGADLQSAKIAFKRTIVPEWAKAKGSSEVMRDLFKDGLIVEKKVSIMKPKSEFRFFADDDNFLNELFYKARNTGRLKKLDFFVMSNIVTDIDTLINNSLVKSTTISVYDKIETCDIYHVTDETTLDWISQNPERFPRKTVTFNKGQKLAKVIRKIVDMLELSITDSQIEKYLLYYSMEISNRKVNGTLCLSIHPMDFLTMSDNAHDWDSCLSVMNGGCYRAGISELLMSPSAIIAYLKSDNVKFKWARDKEWNSKKWRMLVAVDHHTMRQHFAVNGRQYPDTRDDLRDIVMSMIAEGVSTFENRVEPLPKHAGIDISTGIMYNDWSGVHGNYMVVGTQDYFNTPRDHEYYCDFTTDNARCFVCGDYMSSDDSTVCDDCMDVSYCDHCGDKAGDVVYVESTDTYVCESCLDYQFTKCDDCGAYFKSRDVNTVHIKEGNNNPYSMRVCQECEDDISDRAEVCCDYCRTYVMPSAPVVEDYYCSTYCHTRCS